MPTAIHAFSPEEIMAYLDGELAAGRAVAAAQHIEDCRECQGLVSELQVVSTKLAEWGVEPGSEVAPRIVREEKKRPGAFWLRRPWMASCAAALVGLGVFVAMRSPRTSEVTRVERYASLQRAADSVAAPAPPPSKMEAESVAGPLIVRTAQLAIVSGDFDRIRAEVERITRERQGYISQMELNTTAGSSRSLTASLRVPSAQLDAVIGELKRLGHVNSESQSGEDVTQRSVDLDARLANLRTTEKRLQELLQERTGKLSDVLQVEEAVDRTRGEIEQAEAERKTLSNQISFATLQLTVSEEYKAQLGSGDGSVLTRLRNAAIEGYRGAVNGAIGALAFLLSVAPSVLLVGAIAFLPGLLVWRRWRKIKAAV